MGDLHRREPLRELTACGLPEALDVMGERWSFMILRASFNGVHHFEEFLEELGIARNILSSRLVKLVEHGILNRTPCPEDRRRVEYLLTDKGMDLLPCHDRAAAVGPEIRRRGDGEPRAGGRAGPATDRRGRYPVA
jgi:DNA-binding HxlR family transcriptional regulator